MKKKFNIKLYGNEGFNSREEPYLISTNYFYLKLDEETGDYTSKSENEPQVDNDIFITHMLICYKKMVLSRTNVNLYFEKGGTILIKNIEISKEDLDDMILWEKESEINGKF